MNTLTRRMLLKNAAAASAFAMAAGCAPRHAADSATSLAELDGVATARKIRSRALSAPKVLEAAIARAEAAEPILNALAFLDPERARRTQPADGPFSGLPILIKDLADWRGAITTHGSRAFADTVAAGQTPYMDALLGSGAISFGKTTTPEAGLSPTTESLLHGPTRNPWDTNYSTGGSSGGAAAAVAAGVIPIAHASDGAGSIRIPASCCGLFGFKPSRARLIRHDDDKAPLELSVNHVLTRTVRDSAAMFAATERKGDDRRHPAIGMVKSASGKRLRIGLAIAPLIDTPVRDDVRDATLQTAKLCENLGHRIIEITPPLDGPVVADAFITFWAASATAFVRAAHAHKPGAAENDILEPWTIGLSRFYQAKPQGALNEALETLQRASRIYDSMFDSIDLLLTPSMPHAAPLLGELAPDIAFDTLMTRTLAAAAYTPIANVAGAPAMSVPLSNNLADLPIGAHFSGREGHDKRLFQLAYELEDAAPWSGRRPQVWSGDLVR